MKFEAVIFDFDGTLCDTGEGVMKSAKFALDTFGFETPNDYRELTFFIGPPLLVTFQEHFSADAATADKLVQKFRSRYSDIGVMECEIYNEIIPLLKSLKSNGIKIGIASSKPETYIHILLKKFNINQYFDSVCGVTFAADCESKASIIMRCINELNCDTAKTLMVGDKKYDIEGALSNNIKSSGVLWGYGTQIELVQAGADFIASNPSDIEAIALGFFEQCEKYGGIYDGKIITVHCDTVSLVDGSAAKREIVDHPGGVAVAALTEDDEILLVRQFRYAYKEVLYEIPAGKLEKGENPYDAGIREFEEECGAKAKNVFSLGKMYPTPGYCSEIIHLYGATDLTFTKQNLDEGEFLDVIKMPFDTAVAKILNGEIKDAKTIIAILKLKEIKENAHIS